MTERKYSQSMKFSYMDHCSKTVGEKNDCGVKALAIICNTDYETARNALASCGRKPGQGTHVYEVVGAAMALGYKLTKQRDFIPDMLASYPDKTLKHLTTYQPRRFKKQWLRQPTLLLCCFEHMVAFHNGEVHDWSANDPIWIKSVYLVSRLNA